MFDVSLSEANRTIAQLTKQLKFYKDLAVR
jgi:hypothetical protein